MNLTVDRDNLGTPESAWQQSGRIATLPRFDLGYPRKVIVVAPHPDDEVLGVGGLLQTIAASGTPIEVLAVTDGEGSHPSSTAARALDLREIRSQESLLGIWRLGCTDTMVTRLGIPDGRVGEFEGRVRDALTERGRAGDLVLSPWWFDGHPDHDACGRAGAAAAARQGARSVHYLVWAWHWADPEEDNLPWAQCQRFDFDQPTVERKGRSIDAFQSQIRPLGPEPADGPVLPPAVLARFRRNFEVFVDGGME